MLAALALSAGSPVPQDRLVELVWGDRPPRSAARTLQSYIARLRRDLGPETIVRVTGGYQLDLDREAIDVSRFEAHLDAGRLAEALAEWGGPPLAGLDTPGLAPAITGLQERWLAAIEAVLALQVERGSCGDRGRADGADRRAPVPRGALGPADDRSLPIAGRQADALAAYRTARRHLVDQLGLDPGPRLSELERMILGHDDRLTVEAAPETGDRPAGPPSPNDDAESTGGPGGPVGGNAPRRQGRLLGRDQTVTEILTAMTTYPLVTLVGPGGIGKTSLAIAAAMSVGAGAGDDRNEDEGRQLGPDEIWIIELAEVRSGEHVARTVADTLGVVDRADVGLADAVASWLQPRRALLVLDNCEHVISAAAAFVDLVLRDCPNVNVLATSRERLGLGNERIVTVGPLDPARSAADLFIECATTAGHPPAIEGRAEIVEICRRLDGIPLAIELAATRVGSLSPVELLARLDSNHGLRLLRGGRRSAAGPRHETLRAAIGWSYELLDPAERVLFERLSVFTGTFDLIGAEAVGADPPDPGDRAEVDAIDHLDVDVMLGDLVASSMVTVDPARLERRFRLLEPIREFASEQLTSRGQQVRVASRHTSWCLDQVRKIGRHLTGWDEIEAVARLEEIWPNLRTAFDRACEDGDHRLGRELVRPVLGEIVLRSQSELGDWIERLLEVTPSDDEDGLVFGLYWAAHRYTVNQDPDGYRRLLDRYGETDHPFLRHGRAFLLSDHETMIDVLPEVIDLLREQGDQLPAERAEINLMVALLNTGRLTEHEELARRLLGRYRASGPPTFVNWTLTSLGYGAAFQGRSDEADDWFDQALDVPVPPRTHTPSLAHRAGRTFRRGDRRQAYRILRAHITTILDTDNMQAGLLAAIEYVNMMTDADRLPQAARVVRHLATTGLLDSEHWRQLVAPAALDATSTDDHDGPTSEPEPDGRQMLTWIAKDLDDLDRADVQ